MLNLSNKTSPMKSSSVNFIQSKEFESRLDKHLENKIGKNKFVMSSIDIDVLCMQELKVEHDYDCNLLSIPGYVLEIENSTKKRIGCYIRDNLNYERRTDLEAMNTHLLIIDLQGLKKA